MVLLPEAEIMLNSFYIVLLPINNSKGPHKAALVSTDYNGYVVCERELYAH